jgi:hypothetical protein
VHDDPRKKIVRRGVDFSIQHVLLQSILGYCGKHDHLLLSDAKEIQKVRRGLIIGFSAYLTSITDRMDYEAYTNLQDG